MAFETWLQTDLKKPISVQKLSGNLFSADDEANLIGVEVMDNGSPASFSDVSSVHGYIIRADGYTVVTEGTLSGNKASIVLPASAYAVVGQESIVIKVDAVTVGACVAYVYKTTTNVIVDPGSVVPSIAELLAMIGECEEATNDCIEATTEAENVDASISKSDGIVTITITGRSGTSTSCTVHDFVAATVAETQEMIDDYYS